MKGWVWAIGAIGAIVDLDLVKMMFILLNGYRIPNTTRNPLRWGMALPEFFRNHLKKQISLEPGGNERFIFEYSHLLLGLISSGFRFFFTDGLVLFYILQSGGGSILLHIETPIID